MGTCLSDDMAALRLLDNYFISLTETGYVNKKTKSNFLFYLFLMDFVDVLCDYMTGDDIARINSLLCSIFTNGGCLLPYQTIIKNRGVVGKAGYMGILGPRVIESKKKVRYSEDDVTRFKA